SFGAERTPPPCRLQQPGNEGTSGWSVETQLARSHGTTSGATEVSICARVNAGPTAGARPALAAPAEVSERETPPATHARFLSGEGRPRSPRRLRAARVRG